MNMRKTAVQIAIALLLSGCGMSYSPLSGRSGLRDTGKGFMDTANLLSSGGQQCVLHVEANTESLTCSSIDYSFGSMTNLRVFQTIASLRTHYGIGDYQALLVGDIAQEPGLDIAAVSVIQVSYIQITVMNGMSTTINSNEPAPSSGGSAAL